MKGTIFAKLDKVTKDNSTTYNVYLTGDTYNAKELIKSLGFTWSANDDQREINRPDFGGAWKSETYTDVTAIKAFVANLRTEMKKAEYILQPI
jgi:hypothetical protein